MDICHCANRNTNYVISDYSNLFECKDTDVAKRFTETLQIAERNNLPGNHVNDMSGGGYFDDLDSGNDDVDGDPGNDGEHGENAEESV